MNIVTLSDLRPSSVPAVVDIRGVDHLELRAYDLDCEGYTVVTEYRRCPRRGVKNISKLTVTAHDWARARHDC
jgi:hypothetical protein